MEIYNEIVMDLLAKPGDKAGHNLKIRYVQKNTCIWLWSTSSLFECNDNNKQSIFLFLFKIYSG